MFIQDAPSLIALNGGARLRDSAVRLQHYLDLNPGNKARAAEFWADQKALAAKANGHPSDGLFIGTGVRDIRIDCYNVLSAVRMGVAADKLLYEQFCDFFVSANTSVFRITSNLPTSRVVVSGAALSLTLGVSGGIAPYTYTWTRDGAAVGTNSATLSVNPVVVGTYKCVAKDSLGATVTSNNCVVTTPAALSFSKNANGSNASDAAGTYVKFGSAYTNNIVATGGATPYTYQWYKTSGGVDNPVGNGAASITVSSYAEGNNGDYWCRVTDALGAVINSNRDRVKVAVTLNSNLAATETWVTGTSKTLTIRATAGLAPYTYQWYKDGVALTEGANAASLTVASVVAASAGVYHCVVTSSNNNAPNTIESVKCTVTVSAA